MSDFTVATLDNSYVRMALTGAQGTGKTLTALKIAKYLTDNGKVVVIDTERGSAKLYAGDPEVPDPYYVKEITKYSADNYIAQVNKAYEFGADVCIIDSLSQSWNGTQGILDLAGSDIRGWKTANPKLAELINCVTGQNNRMHIIATFRSKPKYSLEPDPSTGKTKVVKHGLEPIHRDEIFYEFDIVAQIDQDHTLSFAGVGKQRVRALAGLEFTNPGKDLALILKATFKGANS